MHLKNLRMVSCTVAFFIFTVGLKANVYLFIQRLTCFAWAKYYGKCALLHSEGRNDQYVRSQAKF